MLVVQGEEFHSELLPRFIETALQILRQASMISSHEIPEIVQGQTTLTLSKQLTLPKQHLLYPGKVAAYIKKFKNTICENKSDSQKQNGKMLIAISDTGHHRILISTLQGRVKVF